MNFASIDFETANRSRVSICAAGLAVFENGTLTESRHWLVSPPKGKGWFLPEFTEDCHGLTPFDVEDAPEFSAIAPEFLALLTSADIVIAHNAQFDIGALRATLNHFGLSCPEFDYLCTWRVAARIWPDLPNHQLDTLAAHIGHGFHHHNAQSDAETAGCVFLAMMKRADAITPSELLRKAGMVPRRSCQYSMNGANVSNKRGKSGEIHLVERHDNSYSAPEMRSQPTFHEGQATVADCVDLLQRLQLLAQRYAGNLEKMQKNGDIGFNLFELISDYYYRENLHSDIIKALLDPNGKHEEKNKFLALFLEFLRSQYGCDINLSDYLSAEVEREKGRIDILVKGMEHAIIIENKVHDADDRWRQLPEYWKYVKGKGYKCDAIIYLRLNEKRPPATDGWTDDEVKKINAILKVICVYDDSEKNLLNGWINNCEKQSNNPDVQHILRQYGRIIKKLGSNIMNKPIMDEFCRILVKDNNFKTALYLHKMLHDLILYRVEKIIDKFKDDLTPFQRIGNYNDRDAYFEMSWKDTRLGLDILVEPESYSYVFWDKNDPAGKNGHAAAILEKMDCLDNFTPENGTTENGKFVTKTAIAFPSEEGRLNEHISNFKKKLGEAINSDAHSP